MLLRVSEGDETFVGSDGELGGVRGSDGACAPAEDGEEMMFSHMLRS